MKKLRGIIIVVCLVVLIVAGVTAGAYFVLRPKYLE